MCKARRQIETFCDKENRMPMRQVPWDSLSGYTKHSGYTLELRGRRGRRKNRMVI